MGLEPMTPTLKVLCSTNWASESNQVTFIKRWMMKASAKVKSFFWNTKQNSIILSECPKVPLRFCICTPQQLVDELNVMTAFVYDFSWQRASSCWAYLQTTLRLDENTLRINGFYISLINRILWSFPDNWLSCYMRFVDKSIDLNGQYACFSRPTACRLSAKVNPLIRLRHAFDGK